VRVSKARPATSSSSSRPPPARCQGCLQHVVAAGRGGSWIRPCGKRKLDLSPASLEEATPSRSGRAALGGFAAIRGQRARRRGARRRCRSSSASGGAVPIWPKLERPRRRRGSRCPELGRSLRRIPLTSATGARGLGRPWISSRPDLLVEVVGGVGEATDGAGEGSRKWRRRWETGVEEVSRIERAERK
jgi:hypothetical protein